MKKETDVLSLNYVQNKTATIPNQLVALNADTSAQNKQSIIPHNITDLYYWETEGASLTTPDLTDSLEQLLARRAAGVQPVSSFLSQPVYPTAPDTLYTAQKLVKGIVEAKTVELEAAKAQLQLHEQETAAKAEQQKREQQEYQDYKSKKDGLKP